MLGTEKRKKYQSDLDSFDRSHIAKVDETIHPLYGGRIQYKNSFWGAYSKNGVEIPQGQPVIVHERVGNYWLVKPYEERD